MVPTKTRYMPTIEHRQMKICSTCFDVTISLLRTIEMIICNASNIMLDKSSTKAEMLLVRLLQVVCLALLGDTGVRTSVVSLAVGKSNHQSFGDEDLRPRRN